MMHPCKASYFTQELCSAFLVLPETMLDSIMGNFPPQTVLNYFMFSFFLKPLFSFSPSMLIFIPFRKSLDQPASRPKYFSF